MVTHSEPGQPIARNRPCPRLSGRAAAAALALAVTWTIALAGRALAQEHSTAEMARAAQNPLANLMSFPFQDNTSYEIGSFDRTQNVLNFQPVLPFKDGRLITRTIIPFVWQPDVSMASGTSTGLGDIQFTAFYSPPSRKVTWGFGPILSFPTGGESRGTDKWSIGPSIVALVMPGQWVVGALVNNVWSFAGDEDAPDVNAFLLQPFINYNFGETGWYLSFSPIITSNWEAPSGQGWIVPLGGTVGKLWRVGKKGLPVNTQVGAFYNVVRPDAGPNWSTRVQVQILLPKHRPAGR